MTLTQNSEHPPVVLGKVTERFDLIDGNVAVPSAYTQDLVLYQRPCLTNPGAGAVSAVSGTVDTPELRAAFPVTPSKQYSIIELLMGKVGIAVYGVDTDEASGVMVGSDGARLADADGNVLDIPAGALSQTVPVSSRTVTGTAALVPDGFALLRTVAVDLTRQTLNVAATMTIPAPQNFDATRPVVIALPVESNNAIQLQLVALGRSSGTSIASDGTLTGLNLPGIVTSGNYYLLQADGPLGYLTGAVLNPAGQAYPNALVTTSGHGLASVSGATGSYRLALASGSHTVTALDPLLSDSGSTSVTINTNSVTGKNITIQPQPPEVVETFPINGQGGVEPSASPVITFSEGVQKESVTGGGLTLTHSDGTTISGAFSFSPDQRIVTFYPATTLKSEANYTLSLGAAIRDLQGYALKDPQTVSFFIRDVTPPVPPPAGAISATFPDEEGYVTVTATQGSAENDVTVLLINNESGAIVGISPNADGSFSAKISAQLGDEVEIVLMDGAGNQTTISYLTFKAPDGRYLVTAKGGKVEGEGGSLLEIPDGALVGPAVVKVTQVTEEELPQPLPQETTFIKAFKVDNGGLPFNREVDLSFPLPENLPEDAVPYIVKPHTLINADGTREEVFLLIDSTKIVDGRLSTASPPHDGIVQDGLYIFTYNDPSGPYGGPVTVSGVTYQDMNGIGGYQHDVDKPVSGAVVRGRGLADVIDISDKDGRYAAFGFAEHGESRSFTVSARHPATMNKVEASLIVSAPFIKNNLNFKLADKDTELPDNTAPAISIGLSIVPDPDHPAVFSAGTIPVGTQLDIPVSIVDQELDKVTFTVTFKTPDMTGVDTFNAGLTESGYELETALDGDQAAIYRYHYQPSFSGAIAGSSAAYFKADRAGTYTFIVDATDADGNVATRKQAITAVNQEDLLEGVEGAPFVTELLPGDGTVDVMVTAPIIATFSEPVVAVDSTTFTLTDLTTNELVPALVYVTVEGGRMRGILQPQRNLHYGRQYKAELSDGITDAHVNNEGENKDKRLPLFLKDNVSTTFTTKQPKTYQLSPADRFKEGSDIVLYERGSNTYAIVAAGDEGWYVLDVSDPGAPRKVFSQSLQGALSWDIRGVAVNRQNGLLVYTESIRYASGNHYGYVRFVNLNELLGRIESGDTPGMVYPLGQEKLAEAYSSIPGRVEMSEDYAYVLSVNVGIQVIDIKAAIKEKSEGVKSSGKTIVGYYSPGGEGYGNASSLDLYTEGKALLGTSSGNLVALDLSSATMPRSTFALLPNNLHATRFAAVKEYVYLTEDGLNQSIDLAVTGTREGQLMTLDLTNPYDVKVLGVAHDEAGFEVTTLVRDVTIAKNSGLVFVTGFGSIQVFDIKDPANPLLLDTITRMPDADGNLVPLGDIDDLVEKGGWLYMAHGTEGLRIADFDPVLLELFCKEEEQGLEGVSDAFCYDYYPALGEKEILLLGRDWTYVGKLDDPAKVNIVNLAALRLEGYEVTPETATFKDGIAKFKLKGTNIKDRKKLAKLEFAIDPNSMPAISSLMSSNDPSVLRTTVELEVRDNSNIKLAEVLMGEAVFVAEDGINGGQHKNDYKIPVEENERLFDYIQELLNQVVPRKRSLTKAKDDGTQEDATYSLLDEKGKS